jgi:hypothetical protein
MKEMLFKETKLGGPRRVSVYLPARFRESRRYPLLIVHDGGDYMRYASLQTVLDNLIHRLEVAPLVVALTHPGDRLSEYPNHPGHAAFIAEQVLPEMKAKFPLYDAPASRCLMGASFGGVAALATAWRYPGHLRPPAPAVGELRVHRHRREQARPDLRPGRRVHQRLPRQAGQALGEGLRVLRHLRVADLREPLDGAGPAGDRHGGPLRGGARRTQLGELARPAPKRAVLAISRAAVDGLRVSFRLQT